VASDNSRALPEAALVRACIVSLAMIAPGRVVFAGDTGRVLCAARTSAGVAPEPGPGLIRIVEEVKDAPAIAISGIITLETGGKKQTIRIVREGRTLNGLRAWRVTRRTRARAVRPLWERADGSTLASDPQYRGRDFTPDGKLIGRAGNIVLEAKLTVGLPEDVHGVRIHVRLEDVFVAAHRYTTRWGMVKSVKDRASEIGRIPPLQLVVRAGKQKGRLVLEDVEEATWNARPKRKDVVRTAGFAFGMGCRYRIAVGGFGAGQAGIMASTALSPAPDPASAPLAKTDAGDLVCALGQSPSEGGR